MTQAVLTKGPIPKTILGLTYPLLIGIYAMITFTLADTYFVSKLGTTALAAISFSFPVTMILVYFILGIGVGTASIVSRAIGRGNHDHAKRFATDGLFLGLIFICFETLIGLTTIRPLFTYLGAKGEVLRLVSEYMGIWYVAIAFFILSMMSNNIIRAAGDTKYPGIIMTVSAIVNVVLDPILIFGYFGCPALGIKGAAVATLIAFIMAAIALLSKQIFHYHLLTVKPASFQECRQSWQQILYIGLPAGLTNVIINIAIAFIMKILATFNEATVAGFGVGIRLEELALAPMHALGGAIAPFTGQNWGSKYYERVREGLSLCTQYCLTSGLIFAAVLALCGKKIAYIFDSDEQVLWVVGLYLLIVPISYGMRGIIIIINAMLSALGKPIPATALSIVRTFILYIPLAFVGKTYWGITGVFFAALIANTVSGFGGLLWYRKYLTGLIKLHTR